MPSRFRVGDVVVVLDGGVPYEIRRIAKLTSRRVDLEDPLGSFDLRSGRLLSIGGSLPLDCRIELATEEHREAVERTKLLMKLHRGLGRLPLHVLRTLAAHMDD